MVPPQIYFNFFSEEQLWFQKVEPIVLTDHGHTQGLHSWFYDIPREVRDSS